MAAYLLILVFSVCLPNEAHAYLDPGTGSMILQLLVAGVAGIGVAIKLYWRRVWAFFKGKVSAPEKNQETK